FYLFSRQREGETVIVGINRTDNDSLEASVDGKMLGFRKPKIICAPEGIHSPRHSLHGAIDWTIKIPFPARNVTAWVCKNAT
ncbi:MAG: hypothetical protein ACT4O9_03525, partial [Blastocatellia bacterium]